MTPTFPRCPIRTPIAVIVAPRGTRLHGPQSGLAPPMDRARLERQMRELALEHAAARLDDAEYLARMACLRGELEIVGSQPVRDLPARRATEWLDALAET